MKKKDIILFCFHKLKLLGGGGGEWYSLLNYGLNRDMQSANDW